MLVKEAKYPDGPGTPLGRITALGDYVVEKGLCSGFEARAPEGFLLEAFEDRSERLGAAYQVISNLLDYLGVLGTEKGQRLLDYFAGHKDAQNPLPFNVYTLLQPEDDVHTTLPDCQCEECQQLNPFMGIGGMGTI